VKRIVAALVVLLCTLTVGAAQVPTPWHIGVTLPLTGLAAAYGVAARNGFEMARVGNPERFKRIVLHYEDTQLQPPRALQSFHALQRRYAPIAFFDFGSATSLALAPVAEQKRALLLSSAYDPAVNRGKKNVFRFANTTADYAQILLDSLRRQGAKRLALVVAENPFFTQFADTLGSLVRAEERVTIYSVQAGETDFGTLAAKIQHARLTYDAVGVFLFVEQATQFLRRWRTLPWNGVVFGTDAFEELGLSHISLSLFEGVLFPNARVNPNFLESYRQEYGSSSHYTFAAGTYDLANLLADASVTCTRCDVEELRETLENPAMRAGAMGGYRFVDSPIAGKHFASSIIMKVIRKGGVEVHEY
jgi:ABC-type branched-subunit amino acid transport system substrate-binding protein